MRTLTVIALFGVACGGSSVGEPRGPGSGALDGGAGDGSSGGASTPDAALPAPQDLAIVHASDGGASDGGTHSLCPSQPPRQGSLCPQEALQCRWPGTVTTWFAYCDGNNRWAVGSIDVGCPASPPENQSACGRTVMDCDYQTGSPGDCMTLCSCDGIGWACYSTCGCVAVPAGVSQCPSGNGSYSLTGDTPSQAAGGFCPASTTAVCVETKNVPATCGTDSWQKTCQCEADRWTCSTAPL